MNKIIRQKKQAAVTLISVIILSFVALAITTTILLVDINNNLRTAALLKGTEALANAETCVEIGLNRLKDDVNYTGAENFILTYGTCEILLISGSGNNNRLLQSVGRSGNYTQRIQVDIGQLNPDTQITSWQIIADF